MNPDDFVSAWRRASPGVRRVLATYAPHRTADDRADLLQDVCVRALEHRETIDPERFAAWCRRTAARLCIDAARLERRRVRTSSAYAGVDEGSIDDEPCARPSALDGLLAEQDRVDALDRFATITPVQRATLLLRAQGLSYEEIRELEGGTAGAARARVHGARESARSEAQRPG